MTKATKKPSSLPFRSAYEDIAEDTYVTMSDGSELRILSTKATEKPNGYTFFLISGWASIVPGWDEVLMEASKDFDVIYIESREKGSSRLKRGVKHNLDRLSLDIKETFEHFNISEEKLIIFGSCYGSLIICNGLAKKKFKAFMPVLSGPPLKLPIPKGLRYFIPFVPGSILYVIKPFVKWWIRKRRTEDEVQAAKYIRVVDEAAPRKWKIVSKWVAIKNYYNSYKEIDDPVLIVDEEEDLMHSTKDTQLIRSSMKNAEYVDMKTNKNTHSTSMVELIRDYIPMFIEKQA